MSASGDTPIFVMSFNRPDYLAKVLKSLAEQADIDLSKQKIALFQDGAVNPFSEKRHARDEDIQACIDIFQGTFPYGTVMVSPVNLGVALNFDRAEKFGFEKLEEEAVIFLEDDLVLNNYYIVTLDQLIDLFSEDSRVGYIGAYGDHTKTLEEQRLNCHRLIPLTHNWGFALYRRQWLRMRPRVLEYLQLVKNVDYTDRDGGAIRGLFASWGFGCPAISQDAAKTIACCLDKVVKVNTFTCNAAYIGEHGLHMNPALFQERGHSRTAVYQERIEVFEPLNAQLYEALLSKQLGWAGKPTPPNVDRKPSPKQMQVNPLAEPELLVKGAYRGLLGRDPDPNGLATYLQLFKGRPVADALQLALERLLLSAEFSRRWHSQAAAMPQSGRNVIPASDVEVVMMTYNEQEMLPYSLLALTPHFTNFLFLDMESTDRTHAVISKILKDSVVRIIPYKREHLLEFGYAYARNFAALHSQKPWLFIIDADEILAEGVADGKIIIDRWVATTAVVVCERRNLKRGAWRPGQPLNTTGLPLGGRELKNRLYRLGGRTRWQGYIHETLSDPGGDAVLGKSKILLDHLSSSRSTRDLASKKQMYAWMTLRAYKDGAMREGVDRFWYEEYVPKHLSEIEADAQAFIKRWSSTYPLLRQF